MKKTSLLAAFLLLLSLTAGCGTQAPAAASSSASGTETLQMERLCLELPRSCAEKPDAVDAFCESLRGALKDHGVDVGKVTVTFGTSEAATAQALEAGGVQAAVLSGESYVKYGSGSLVVAAGDVLNERDDGDSTDPAVWNGEEALTAQRQTPRAGLRTLLAAGPSDYGAQLARRVQNGKTPSWTELDHAAWGVLAGDTAMASQWLEDNYEGNTIEDLSTVTTFDTYADLLWALANGEVDAAVLPEDMFFYCVDLGMWTAPAFEPVENSASRGLGRENPMWDEVTVLGVSERYFTAVMAVSVTDQTVSSSTFTAALQAALLNLSQSHQEVLAEAGLPAMVGVTDDQFDGMRRALAGEK
ncbi:MAG: PhnD/SsuA/transferrin family substrate-binding protein [Oscillibacter sp.]|jgi:phosphonate transport system substrate-binding protein|nr:PhnD/SsuA/transferrin family substrate-binding protein [Oscillibacter sp.]